MMSHSHAFFSHLPNWVGFAVLIGVWVLFRNVLLGRQRKAARRMWTVISAPPPPIHGQIRCPRCAAGAPGVAMYCPHCGLSFASLPPPVPVQTARSPGRALMPLVWLLLGLIGLAAFLFWRFGADEPAPPPEPPHVRTHQYYR